MNQSNKFFLVLTCLLLFFVSVQYAQQSGNKPGKGYTTANDTSDVQLIYQCQIHPQILSNADGRCPRCENLLKALPLEQAFANLSEKGIKKPELKPNFVTKTVVEEEVEVEDSSEVTDSVYYNEDILAEYDFETIDHDGDGWLYQCPKHPLEFEDDGEKCLVCGTAYEFRTVDEVKTKLVNMRPVKEPEEEETTAANKP